MKEENLHDYLYRHVDKFDLSEEEKKEVLEYIELLDSELRNFYSFFNKDESKIELVKYIESLGREKKDV